MLLERNDDGSLSTSVYRPSHTDRYLDFTSHHPLMHKASVVKSLFNRAKSHSSCAVRLNKENRYIFNVLKANHYPKRFIDNNDADSHKHSSEETPLKTVVIPYIKGLSEGIKRILSIVEVKVVFRPLTSLRQHLVRPKDPVPSMCKANVVYSIPCTVCSAVYIGQTSRSLETRMKEHKAAVKHAKIENSAVAEHVWQKNHQIDFNNVSILVQERNDHKHCSLESWHIQKQDTFNRGPLPPVYRCLFKFF